MINFRFHLVSLIAVFLALALGIVVGSTVIDRAIVAGLKTQIDRVERNADDQRQENEQLQREIEQVRAFADEEVPFVVQGRLSEVPVVVLATRGVDEEDTHAIVQTVREAGALAPALLWIEPEFAVTEPEARSALRELLGLPRADPADLQRIALAQLVARLGAGELAPVVPVEGDPSVPAEGAPVPAESPPPVPDPITELVDRGFLTVDRVGGAEFDLATFPGAGARAVVIGGPAAEFAREVLPVLVEELVDAALLTLAAEVGDDGEDGPRGEVVGVIRSADELRDRVSTIDNAAQVPGRLAVALALADLGRGLRGHYGVAGGASRLLPVPVDT